MSASEIRALFAVASRPEVVSLAGGMPFVQALNLDTMADTVQRVRKHCSMDPVKVTSACANRSLT